MSLPSAPQPQANQSPPFPAQPSVCRLPTWVQDVPQVCACEEHGVVAPKVRLARHLRLRHAPLAAAAAAAATTIAAATPTSTPVYGLYVEHHILDQGSAGQHGLEGLPPVHGSVHVCGAKCEGVQKCEAAGHSAAQHQGAKAAQGAGQLGGQADQVILHDRQTDSADQR